MNDFGDYEPGRTRFGDILPGGAPTIRMACSSDGEGLARVMAARHGNVADDAERARGLLGRLPVLLVAELDRRIVGWSGAQKFSIEPDAAKQWLIAGLTVVPDQRRRGIAARLLREVLRIVRLEAPGEAIFSVVNIRNRASIDLHTSLGFREVARAATFARIEFTGGEGVLLGYP